MFTPTLVFSFVVATLIGALFHVVLGGGGRRLVVYLTAAWVGFAIGQGIGILTGSSLITIGSLRAESAGAGALIALVAARLLSGAQRAERRT